MTLKDFDPDILAHYGVRGMKWDVRRTKEQLQHDKGSIFTTVNRYLGHKITTRDGVRVTRIAIHTAERYGHKNEKSITDNLDVHRGHRRYSNGCSYRQSYAQGSGARKGG